MVRQYLNSTLRALAAIPYLAIARTGVHISALIAVTRIVCKLSNSNRILLKILYRIQIHS